MIPKILNQIKAHHHGIFVGFCILLVAGTGYNIGRIYSMHRTPDVSAQEANISITATGDKASVKSKRTPAPTPPRDIRVVTSKNSKSKLYHYSWCSGAKRIKPTNQIWFPTEADAISAGYTLAGNCQ